MVRYYCYFEIKGQIRPDSKVFKVKVGSSRRDQTKRALLENYAADCGFYFRPWDEITESELIFRSSNLFSACGQVGRNFKIILLDVQSLYRHIINGDLHTVQQTSNYLKNLFRSKTIMYPFQIRSKKTNPEKTICEILPRKYLSRHHESIAMSAIVGLVATLGLFLLGALLEGIERGCV